MDSDASSRMSSKSVQESMLSRSSTLSHHPSGQKPMRLREKATRMHNRTASIWERWGDSRSSHVFIEYYSPCHGNCTYCHCLWLGV